MGKLGLCSPAITLVPFINPARGGRVQYLLQLSRNFIVLPKLGVAYGRIPKVANTTIKRCLAETAGIERAFKDGRFSSDAHWRNKSPAAFFMSARAMRRKFPDIYAFTFVREPLSRTASCYRSKIELPRELPASFRREGLSKKTTFPEFVRHVARRPDWRSNVHYRSQSHILADKSELAVDFVGRFESVEEDWERLRRELAAHGRTPPAAFPQRNGGARRPPILQPGDYFNGDDALIELIRHRFADDYRRFYPKIFT